MGVVRDLFRVMFQPTGPRRERAEEIDRAFDAEQHRNFGALRDNKEAVFTLLSETLDLAEGRNNAHPTR